MYYDTIQITVINNKWVVSHCQQNGAREERDHYTPSPLGFFHYPREYGIKKGFDILKETMIKPHEEEIERLSKSLADLRAVTPPDIH